MKEIGGYFGLENLINKEIYSNLIALNNARNSLVYLVNAKKIKKIYIPYFLCDSISKVCIRENIIYEYYYIDKFLRPIFDKKLNCDEYLYIVNYYGQINNEELLKYENKYTNIIVDNVQAFFQKPIEGIDTIYSCRKFFGVPDGSYLSTDAVLDYSLEQDKSIERMTHILGRFEEENASNYYNSFKSNDKSFISLKLKTMSKITHNILGAIDYEFVKRRREENFNFLHSQLGKLNKLDIKNVEGPYAYPFYCENGMKIKKMLADKKIYVATLWPNVLEMENCLEKDFAENILPLPCDQRYNKNDMVRIVSTIKELLCI